MENKKKSDDEISIYIEDKEYMANKYVMKCFAVTMLVFFVCFLLNLMGIFIIKQSLMIKCCIPLFIVYSIMYIVSKNVSLSNKYMKYYILLSIVIAISIGEIFITYHVLLVTLLPFLYATLYSSKKVIRYVFVLKVISTIIVVYTGYYFGLCDANMVLLTTNNMSDYVVNGQFVLTEINSNPIVNLFIFFIMPRCFIYLAYMSVSGSILKIVSGSVEKAKITKELEKAKIEAEKLKEEAEQANKAKTKFLARMSHEIRTPINAIMGMNEMIIRENKDDTIKEYAYDVKESSKLLLDIVNDTLDSSKIESGMMKVVPVEYKITSIFNDIYNMTIIKAKEKGLELEFDISSNIPCECYGDIKLIKQVLLNLLTNAIKYTEKGKVTFRAKSEIKGSKVILYYSVIDTGIGIKTEDLDKIYDEFQRFDVSKNRNVEGTGLGMNIVGQVLKLMNSELNIKSEYGKGSEFYFELEQDIINEKPIGEFRKRIKDVSEYNQEYKPTFTASKAKILVVDDSDMNLKVFKNLLKETLINVIEADSGEKCLEILKTEKFDIIFMDHMMPEMDGVEVLHRIKTENLCTDTPVIMLTANVIVGDKERFLKEGFDDFLSKPIKVDKLENMLKKYLKEKDLIDNDKNDEYENNVPIIKSEEKMENINKKADIWTALDKRLPEIDFNMGMTTCGGDKEFYIEIFTDFVNLNIKEELTKFMNNNDYENYCIRIHGFKNNAYSVGAKALGDLAYEMEKLTKNALSSDIKPMQENLFEQYDRVCKQFNNVVMLVKSTTN